MATKHDNIFTGIIILLILVALLWLLIGIPAEAAWTPSGFNDWRDGEKGVTDIGNLPRNYQKADGSWEEIDTTWESVGDTLFTCRKAVVTADAWPNGVSEFTVALKNDTVKIKQILDRLIFIDTLTWDRYDLITDIPLSNFTHAGRELSWNFPGGKYRLRKGFGRTASQVVFKKALLDSVCKLYGKLPLDSITTMVDSVSHWDEEGDTAVIVQVPVITTLPERVALGTVFKYEISGIPDSLLTKHPGVIRKKLHKFGRRVLCITSNKLHFQGEENVPEIPILQEWRKIGGNLYLCEYLMMWQLDSLHTVFPNKTVWHGATEEVEDMGVEDTFITEPSDWNYNYGGVDHLHIGKALAANTDTSILIRCVDVAATLGAGATVESCTLFMPIILSSDPGDIDAFRLFKYFIEGTEPTGARPDPDSGATLHFFQGIKYRLGNTGYLWASLDAGASGPHCADDNGIDNLTSGGTCVSARADRTSTYMSTNMVDASDIWGWEITTALAQDWYDGDAAENGIFLRPRNQLSATANSSEATGDINGAPVLPYFRFRYTVSEEDANRRRAVIERTNQ
jgi:hypothetical protein